MPALSNAWIINVTKADGTTVRLVQPMRYMRRAGVASIIRLARSTGATVAVSLGDAREA